MENVASPGGLGQALTEFVDVGIWGISDRLRSLERAAVHNSSRPGAYVWVILPDPSPRM